MYEFFKNNFTNIFLIKRLFFFILEVSNVFLVHVKLPNHKLKTVKYHSEDGFG